MDMNAYDINDDSSISGVKKSYRGNFSSLKEESIGCPYGGCGRKFVSADQLRQHVERRHVPKIVAPPNKEFKEPK